MEIMQGLFFISEEYRLISLVNNFLLGKGEGQWTLTLI